MQELLIDTLNPQQKQAATITDRHVRIVAGAGSGKTRVLMARMEYLIRKKHVYPSRILAITFTNKAANEMKERLDQQMGMEASGVRISTIHSLCVRILREDALELDYPKNFTIFDSDDQRNLLLGFYKEYKIDKKSYPPASLLSYISNWKTKRMDPDEVMENYDNYVSKQQRVAAELYPLYQDKLWQMRAMDFDDLLIKAHQLLSENEEVRTKWQNRLDYLHVDEFQDVDPLQYEIVKNLCGKHAYLCVVGDPDQTIYTWRGASVNIILNYDKDFKPCHTVLLTQNYRSSKAILDAANSVIAQNRQRVKKDLFTNQEQGSPLVLHDAESDEAEAEYVVSKIQNDHSIMNTDYSEIAILYRSNFSSRAFEKALRNKGIPYRIFGGLRFYDRKEIKDILAYLKLALGAQDLDKRNLDLPLLRVINEPKRAIGAKSLEKIQAEADQRNLSLIEVIADPQTIKGAAAKKIKAFYQLIDQLQKQAEYLSVNELIDEILQSSQYQKMLEDNQEKERLDNITELKKDFEHLNGTAKEVLPLYFQDVSLYSERGSEEYANGVTLMTVHASKGTEFNNIYLVNFNDGIFPTRRAIESNAHVSNSAMEEERRLFYVAITRARKNLAITWNNGFSYATSMHKTPSRFIKDLPEQSVGGSSEWKAKKQIQPAKKSKAESSFHRGDVVLHTKYGEGVVIDVSDYQVEVAFDHKTGVKTLNANHESLSHKCLN